MRAVVFDRHGPPEVLRVVDLADPVPGPGQVRVRVHAAGIRARRSARQLGELVALYRDGALGVTIRAAFSLEEIVHAHREVETGHGTGKVVVTLDD